MTTATTTTRGTKSINKTSSRGRNRNKNKQKSRHDNRPTNVMVPVPVSHYTSSLYVCAGSDDANEEQQEQEGQVTPRKPSRSSLEIWADRERAKRRCVQELDAASAQAGRGKEGEEGMA